MDKSDKEICMNEIKMYIDDYGTKIYTNSKGQFHRLYGPAIELVNGDKKWYKEGELHKTDGPAEEYSDESKFWWVLDRYLEEKEFNSWISRIKKFV